MDVGPPAVLDLFREDLSELEARNGRATATGSHAASNLKMAVFVTLVPVSMFAAFLLYQHLQVPAPPVASAPQSVPVPEQVAIPPASKGERFKVNFVRYCYFQEERLRVIKLHVRGAAISRPSICLRTTTTRAAPISIIRTRI